MSVARGASRARASADVGEPAATTRRAIAEVAVRIIEEEGLDALSVRRLGAELGIHYSSIYHHFQNKHEILGAVSLLVLQDLKLPDAGDEWLSYLVDMNLAYRNVLLAHPNVVSLMLQHPNPRRGAVRDALIELVKTEGGTAAEVDNVLEVAEVYAIGLVLVHSVSPTPKSEVSPVTDDGVFLESLSALLRATFDASKRARSRPKRRRRIDA